MKTIITIGEMAKSSNINEGGIVGTGKGTIKTQGADFKGLQEKILEQSQKRSQIKGLEDQLLAVRFSMEEYISEEQPSKLVPPGAFLNTCIEVLGIKKKDFAAYVGLEESNLSDYLKGRRKINPELAIKFGKIFNIPPRIWLDAQSKNDLLAIRKEKTSNFKELGLKDLLVKSGRLAAAS